MVKGLCLVCSKSTVGNEALAAREQGIQLGDNSSTAYIGKGYELYDLGRYNEAIESFDMAIKLDPENLNAYSAKAKAIRKHEERN